MDRVLFSRVRARTIPPLSLVSVDGSPDWVGWGRNHRSTLIHSKREGCHPSPSPPHPPKHTRRESFFSTLFPLSLSFLRVVCGVSVVWCVVEAKEAKEAKEAPSWRNRSCVDSRGCCCVRRNPNRTSTTKEENVGDTRTTRRRKTTWWNTPCTNWEKWHTETRQERTIRPMHMACHRRNQEKEKTNRKEKEKHVPIHKDGTCCTRASWDWTRKTGTPGTPVPWPWEEWCEGCKTHDPTS